MATLAELISIARECKGWTLRDLDKASGVSHALISQIETGKVLNPGFTTVVRLVDALGLTLDRAAAAERAKLDVLRKTGVWTPSPPAGDERPGHSPELEQSLRRAAKSLSKTPPELRLFKVPPAGDERPGAYYDKQGNLIGTYERKRKSPAGDER